MNHARSYLAAALLALAAAAPAPCDRMAAPALDGPKGLVLTIAHVNDTHQRLEPRRVGVRLEVESLGAELEVRLEVGGAARLELAVERLRRQAQHVLLLHGGDFFRPRLEVDSSTQDTDVSYWNRLGLDAAVLGNHEFDRGPSFLAARFLRRAEFPVVSANVEVSREPALAALGTIHRYVVREYAGTRVGIVGLTLPATGWMSSPGRHVRFQPARPAVQQTIDELHSQGVNAVILLSHQGYGADCRLARKLSGVDVIVGGHSHTLVGTFEGFRWRTRGEYPTVLSDREGNPVLVVQAGRWGEALGSLTVEFDPRGVIRAFDGRSVALVGDSWLQLRLPGPGPGRSRWVEYRFAGDGSLAVRGPAAAGAAPSEDGFPSEDGLRVLLREVITALIGNRSVWIVHDGPLSGERLGFFAGSPAPAALTNLAAGSQTRRTRP